MDKTLTESDCPKIELKCDIDGFRLDNFILQNLAHSFYSRSGLKKEINLGRVRVDGKQITKAGFRLRPGQVVCFYPQPAQENIEPVKRDLEIIYSDDALVVLNKPPGLTVHPAESEKGPTLVHHLLYHFPVLHEYSSQRPGIVHRLDKNTSGLMMVALGEKQRRFLAEEFAARNVYKEYLCLCCGVPDAGHGIIRHEIGRHSRIKTKMAVMRPGRGREACTEYTMLCRGPGWSLLRVRIYTGRTHQIRVHMACEGVPVMGDRVYGGGDLRPFAAKNKILFKLINRQLLHAWKLSFTHPETKERLHFVQPPPKDFFQVLLWLNRRPQKVIVVGSPGSGKSEVLKMLDDLNTCTWSADHCVKKLYEKDGLGWEILRKAFGSRFVSDAENEVDKKALFSAMLEDDALRREIEHLIHPLVRAELDDFFARNSKRIGVAEVPLFFESGFNAETGYDLCIGVFAPEEERRLRLANRGWDRRTIDKVDSWQWKQKDKLRGCHLLLDNSGDIKDLEKKVHTLKILLRKQRIKKCRRFYSYLQELTRQ